MKKFFDDWNLFEKVFLIVGLLVAILSTVLFQGSTVNLIYTLLYFITALLLAKGHYFCYIICFISTFFYAYVSYKNGYYGEIVVSLGMTLPLSIYGLINWLKNLYNKKTVKIKQMDKKEVIILIISQIILFFAYYFILKAFNTNNLLVSTFSVAASIMATYCTARRSENGFLFYIINDIILIVLWALPVINGELNLISVLICPILLFINDCYGYYNWKKIFKSQNKVNIAN